jgi:hypothetical protein
LNLWILSCERNKHKRTASLGGLLPLFSDELVRAINENEVYNSDDAWLVFADRIDELLEELAVAVQK